MNKNEKRNFIKVITDTFELSKSAQFKLKVKCINIKTINKPLLELIKNAAITNTQAQDYLYPILRVYNSLDTSSLPVGYLINTTSVLINSVFHEHLYPGVVKNLQKLHRGYVLILKEQGSYFETTVNLTNKISDTYTKVFFNTPIITSFDNGEQKIDVVIKFTPISTERLLVKIKTKVAIDDEHMNKFTQLIRAKLSDKTYNDALRDVQIEKENPVQIHLQQPLKMERIY